MTTIATLEDIVARIGVEVKESEVRFRRKMEEFTKGLEASRAEADKRQAEADKRQAEADKRQAEADKSMAALKDRIDAVGCHVDKVSKQIGGINENIGYHAEQFFQNTLAETKTFGGEKYDEIYPNFNHGHKAAGGVEFDLFLVNGKSVAIIEVKNRIHPNFVQEIATEKIAKFRKFFPEYQNHKAYLGIAGFSFCQAVCDEAQKFGVGIIKQVGDSVEIDAGHLKAY